MGLFIEYRKARELAELCVRRGIDLAPLVELSERLLFNTDLAPEELHREFLQQAANMVGNLAGRAVNGIGNMAKSFGQGYQQSTGQNGQQQGQQQQVQQGAQNQQQGGGAAAANVQNVMNMLAILKDNMQGMSKGNTNLANGLMKMAQPIDQITQMIQQMAQASAQR